MISLKVKELIQQLQTFDEELEVATMSREYEYNKGITKDENFKCYTKNLVDCTVINNKCVLLYE